MLPYIIRTIENYLKDENILYFKFEDGEFITFGAATDVEDVTLVITFHNSDNGYVLTYCGYKRETFENMCNKYKDITRENVKNNKPCYIHIYSEYAKLYILISKDEVIKEILKEGEK